MQWIVNIKVLNNPTVLHSDEKKVIFIMLFLNVTTQDDIK